MSGSTFGKCFTATTWGESHGPAIGVVVDGCPAGVPLSAKDIQADLERRKPGQSPFASPRKESDTVEIMSGVFDGQTTGTPISLIIPSANMRPKDYSAISQYYRPGHADYTYDQKYGFRDFRGGGRSSGRETAGRVAAGAVARQLLHEFGITISAYTSRIGPVSCDPDRFEQAEIHRNFLAMPDASAAQEAAEFLAQQKEREDSTGGQIECIAENVPPGLGEPVFDKLDALLAHALMSIGAVKAVEVGSGVAAAQMSGSEHNDSLEYFEGKLTKKSNHAGGSVGGISDGFAIRLRATVKPTPSIHKSQQTITRKGANTEVAIEGRHDPIIVPRAVIVVEAMVALTLADLLLQRSASRLDWLKRGMGYA